MRLQRIGQAGVCLYLCLGLTFGSVALAKTTDAIGALVDGSLESDCEKLYQMPSSKAFDACRLAVKKEPLSEENWQRWGQLHFRVGSFAKAQRYFSKALSLARGFGNDRAIALALNGLARTSRANRASSKAGNLFRQSLVYCHEDKNCVAGNQDGLGYIALKQKQYVKAANSFNLCLANAANKKLRPSCMYGLAIVSFQNNKTDKAHDLCGKSLVLYEQANNKRGMAAALGCLAATAKQNHGSKQQWCAYKARRVRLYQELGELKKSIILQRGIDRSNCLSGQ